MKLVLVILACLLLPRSAPAEDRVWRLGVLTPGDWAHSSLRSVMVPELARRGFVEGRNLVVVPRWGRGGDEDELAGIAGELAATKPDVIVAVSLPAVRAAMKAAPGTPIVASFVDDPVKDGLASSLSHPGGKVTGIAMLASEGDAKRLELLHEAIPAARRLGYLASTANTGAATQSIERSAAGLGLKIVGIEVSSAAEYRAAFDAMRDAQVGGVVIASSPVFYRDAAQLASLAAERRLPTVCEWREMAGAGCLVGYGPNIDELRLRTADFVLRLFDGGKASDMPFEQPTHFEMGINSQVAHRIGVTLPGSLLARADEVIE